MRSLACAAALVALGPAVAEALDPTRAVGQYVHRAWRSEDGLPHDSITALAQDAQGYLWIGTVSGLVRFDGVRFTPYRQDEAAPFGSDYVTALAADPAGGVWVATAGGGLAHLRQGRFTRYGRAEGLPSEALTSVAVSPDGTLWAGTDGGVVRLRAGRMRVLTGRDGLPADDGYSLVPARDGTVLGGGSGGVFRLRGERVEMVAPREDIGGGSISGHLFEDRRGRIWVPTSQGLRVVGDGRVERYGTEQGLSDPWTRAVLEDRHGNVWVATRSDGLNLIRGGRVSTFRAADGLAGDFVRALLEDREGNLWVGTGNGLSRFSDGAVTTLGPREGLTNAFVWSVLQDRAGRIWAGTNSGGLYRREPGAEAAFERVPGLSGPDVHALLEDAQGALWVGTWGHGLNRLRHGAVTVFRHTDGLASDVVNALHEDRGGTLWVGTAAGLSRIRDGRVLGTLRRADGLPHDTVRALAGDAQGRLWIGTAAGAAVLESDGRLRPLQVTELDGRRIFSVRPEPDGTLWFGTYGGLVRLRGEAAFAFDSRHGLPDEVVYTVVADSRGGLWCSSNRGIFRLDRAEAEEVAQGRQGGLRALLLGRADGMKGAECNGGTPAGLQARDGRLYFPTIAGLAVVDPGAAPPPAEAPPVVLEELRAGGEELEVAARVRVPPGRGRLELRYTGLSLGRPEQLAFRYRLEGFDEAWVEAGGERVARYTNVPPGRYRFAVAARNGQGPWSDPPAGMELVLEPRWHQTRAWYGSSVALLGLAMAGAWRLRLRRLRRRERELQDLVEARTADLREAIRLKDEVVSIVSHDFRSPLTLIQGYGEVLAGRAQDEDSRRLLHLIQSQSRYLAGLASDMLAMTRIEAGPLPLEKRPVRVVELTRALAEAREEESGLRVAVEAADPGLTVQADYDRLWQVVDNLLSNAIKYSPAGATVRVAVARVAEGVEVAVRDEGDGIPAAEMDRLFKKFSRLSSAERRRIPGTGLGLYICRSIVEAHGGRIRAESPPGGGAVFTFVIPG